MPLRLRQEIQEVSRRGKIEQFSNSRAVSGIEQGGFFLRKKPLSINGLPLQQLENCYSHEMRPETGPRFALNYRSAGTMDKVVHLFTRVKTLPLYAYRCTQCGYKFEKIQNFSATQETECPKCQGVLERPLTAPRLHFKEIGRAS